MSDQVQVQAPTQTQNESQTPPPEGKPSGTPSAPSGAPQPGDVSSAAKEAMRKYKVKVEGKDIEVDEKELLRGYGHQRAASKALNEGKALRAQAENFIQMLKDEGQLRDVLKRLGHDPRKLSEKILAEHLEDELMDPKDKRLKFLETEFTKREQKEKLEKEAFEKRAHEQRIQKYQEKYEKEILTELEKGKLPKTKNTVGRIAAYIKKAAEHKIEMTTQEAAQLVAQDLREEHKLIAVDSEIEALINTYGDDFLNKVRKYDTSRLKDPASVLKTPEAQGEPTRDRNKNRKGRMSQREWQRFKRGH